MCTVHTRAANNLARERENQTVNVENRSGAVLARKSAESFFLKNPPKNIPPHTHNTPTLTVHQQHVGQQRDLPNSNSLALNQ